MGFLDNIKDRLNISGGDDGYYEDDYYDEPDEAGYAPESQRRDTGSSPRLLGNTPRPEADSVNVYTRSGRPLANQTAAGATTSFKPISGGASGGYGTSGYGTSDYQPRSYEPSYSSNPAPAPVQHIGSGNLPAYVLRPVSYEDVQTVVRRVKTNQPVVLSFRNTNIETAKRILDFCFGLAYGIDGEIQEVGDRVFAVLPAGLKLTATDLDKLVADGDLQQH